MTERMASRGVWKLDTGRLKRFGRDAVKMVETTVQLGAIPPKESEEMQIGR